MVTDLMSLQQIFDRKIFRVPDYQRGFSWNTEHVEDLWEDILNIRRIHYTGMITVHPPTEREISKWKKEFPYLKDTSNHIKVGGVKYELLFIVDGQQRLTSLFILLAALSRIKYNLKNLPHPESYLLIPNTSSYIPRFGYDFDTPSHQYLVSKILQNDKEVFNGNNTAYTFNIQNAYNFFENKINEIIKKESNDNISIRKIYKNVLKKIKFNYWEIPNRHLNIFTVFETMNYRGLPLSTLELLKNRLMFLVEHLKDAKRKSKHKLREHINSSWLTIYESLSMHEDGRTIKDDDFLRIHWMMYLNHDNKKAKDLKKFKENLLDEKFIKKRALNAELTFQKIWDYVENLSASAPRYFELRYPKSNASRLDFGVAYWMQKINRLGTKYFEPLILAGLLKLEKDDLLKLLKSIERYLFLIFEVSGRISSYFKVDFIKTANQLFRVRLPGSKSFDEITSDQERLEFIQNYILDQLSPKRKRARGNHIDDIELIKDRFSKNMEKCFKLETGFNDWGTKGKSLKYFLYEYEEYLRGDHMQLVDFDKCEIENIFPPKLEPPLRDRDKIRASKEFNKSIRIKWSIFFRRGLGDGTRLYLSRSLGNMLLLKKKPREYENLVSRMKINSVSGTDESKTPSPKIKFLEKKGFYSRMTSESYSSRELNKLYSWTPELILKRGIDLLKFMEERWKIKIDKIEEPLPIEFPTQPGEISIKTDIENNPDKEKIRLLQLGGNIYANIKFDNNESEVSNDIQLPLIQENENNEEGIFEIEDNDIIIVTEEDDDLS